MKEESNISIADQAKNHLAVELGNQKRFLYEYHGKQLGCCVKSFARSK